jgi:hypothetical protein
MWCAPNNITTIMNRKPTSNNGSPFIDLNLLVHVESYRRPGLRVRGGPTDAVVASELAHLPENLAVPENVAS